MSLKAIILSAILSVAALGSASAATYHGTLTLAPAFNLTNPGLQVRANPIKNSGSQVYTGAPISFENLNEIGNSFSLPLFVVRTLEPTVDPDDMTPKPFALLFNLAGFGSATVTGTTVGVIKDGYHFGRIVFDNVAAIRVSATEQILISLASTIFNQGEGALRPGKANGATITAVATLAAVPVPASLPLAALGLGLLALVARRRKAQAV
jgi:hypothetical protein